MFPEPTELLLIGCSIESIWTPDTKNQLADMVTKGNFTRDEWNNLLHLFNISFFSSTCCAENSSFDKLPSNDGEEDTRTKKKKTGLWQNRRPWR